MEKVETCYLVMFGNTPVAVYKKEKAALRKAKECAGNAVVLTMLLQS